MSESKKFSDQKMMVASLTQPVMMDMVGLGGYACSPGTMLPMGVPVGSLCRSGRKENTMRFKFSRADRDRGIGAPYAQRLVGDGLSVDVRRVKKGQYQATVRTNGGYAGAAFGPAIQGKVARTKNGYHVAVNTQPGIGAVHFDPISGGRMRAAGAVLPKRGTFGAQFVGIGRSLPLQYPARYIPRRQVPYSFPRGAYYGPRR
jgi:hypothetical protein